MGMSVADFRSRFVVCGVLNSCGFWVVYWCVVLFAHELDYGLGLDEEWF